MQRCRTFSGWGFKGKGAGTYAFHIASYFPATIFLPSGHFAPVSPQICLGRGLSTCNKLQGWESRRQLRLKSNNTSFWKTFHTHCSLLDSLLAGIIAELEVLCSPCHPLEDVPVHGTSTIYFLDTTVKLCEGCIGTM